MVASRARALPSATTRPPGWVACSSRRQPASSCPTRAGSFRWWARWFWRRAPRIPCTPCSQTTSRRRAYSPRWTPCAWTRWTTAAFWCSRAAGGGSWCSAARSRAGSPSTRRATGDTWRRACTKKDSSASSRSWTVSEDVETGGVRVRHTLALRPALTPPYAHEIFLKQIEGILKDVENEVAAWDGRGYRKRGGRRRFAARRRERRRDRRGRPGALFPVMVVYAFRLDSAENPCVSLP